ncbi:MAG: LytTR family DNA-binding domain-containing protein [Clostridia bacterium]|nr:LytTR family DNA-binding domain-containing protein [Clostridia bacterium]
MRKIYRVAIVEDEAVWSDALQRMLRTFERENGLTIESTVYTSIETFLATYKERYDLVFMDIELPGMNGMDGARKLREIDTTVTLIFVTNLAQFAVQGYEVSALDYLVKPVNYNNFSVKMLSALEAIGKADSKRVAVFGKTEVHSMSIHEILYVEVYGHHLLFHKTDGSSVDACGSLSTLEEELKDMGFSRCNVCYLLNMKYITKINAQNVTLADGTELQISRRRRKEFMDEFAVYIGKYGRGSSTPCGSPS